MTIAVDTVTPRMNLRTIVSSFPLSRFPLNSLPGYAGSRYTAGWHASNSLRGLRLDAGQLRSPRRHQRPVGQPRRLGSEAAEPRPALHALVGWLARDLRAHGVIAAV